MLLDIALGILVAVFLDIFFELNFFVVLFFSIVFSLLPDLDFIIYKILGIHEDKGYKHRDLFHSPLLYLPIGTILIYLTFGKIIAIAFLIISTLHFLHDSIACGRGIKWLYPFSQNSYAFIYEYSRIRRKGIWKPVFIFDEKYLKYFDKKHGDENWIENIYKSWHPIAIIETGVFVISIFILLIYLYL